MPIKLVGHYLVVRRGVVLTVSCIYKVFKITALKYLWSCALSNVSGIASIISITVVNLISLFSTLIFW